MTKTLHKVGREGTYLNIIKAIYNISIANILLSGETLKAFPLRLGKRRGCPLLFNTVLEVLATETRKWRNKDTQTRKEEVKLSLFAADMILYIENPKHITKKLLEFINEFGEVAGYKINIQKSLAFLNTNNELSAREIKTIPFKITSKRIKYLGVNPIKEVKDKYSKLMKEIEDNINRWKGTTCYGLN